MRRKYYLCTLVLVGSMFLFSGCTTTETKESNTDNVKVNDTKQEGKLEHENNIEEFSGGVDFTYVYETDCQSNRADYATTVYTKEGCYDFVTNTKDETYLTYLDYATGENVYVCSKSNCEHNKDTCDAFFSNEKFTLTDLWYYDGNLYTPMIEEEYIYICKISPDGSNREKICKLMRQNVEEKEDEEGVSKRYYIPEMQIHRGYVYFSDYYIGCEETSLFRVKLEANADVEKIYNISGNDACIYRIKPYGNGVLFQMGVSKEDEISDSIYVYHTETAKLSCICEDSHKEFMLKEPYIYYIASENNVRRKNLEDGSDEEFYQVKKEEDAIYSIQLFEWNKKIVYQIGIVNEEKSIEQHIVDTTGQVSEIRKESNEDILLTPYSMLAEE